MLETIEAFCEFEMCLLMTGFRRERIMPTASLTSGSLS